MEQNFSKIKKRILQHLDVEGITKRKFYLKTGMANGVLDKKTGLGEENIERYISTYPYINPQWLLTGKGKMFIKEPEGIANRKERMNILYESLSDITPEKRELIRKKDVWKDKLTNELLQGKYSNITEIKLLIKDLHELEPVINQVIRQYLSPVERAINLSDIENVNTYKDYKQNVIDTCIQVEKYVPIIKELKKLIIDFCSNLQQLDDKFVLEDITPPF